MAKSNTRAFLEALVISTILSIILLAILGIPKIKKVFLEIIFPENTIIPFPYNVILGLSIIVMGFALIIWANYTLLQKISIEEREPFHTPSALVVNGPFQYSRNPVYLSAIIIVFGIAILLGSVTTWVFFLLPPIFFIVFQRFFIRWEEKKLEEVFGEEYLEFKKRVKRWF